MDCLSITLYLGYISEVLSVRVFCICTIRVPFSYLVVPCKMNPTPLFCCINVLPLTSRAEQEPDTIASLGEAMAMVITCSSCSFHGFPILVNSAYNLVVCQVLLSLACTLERRNN